MISLKPNQYTIKNGKLQPKEESTHSSNYRIIPYSHTVRVNADDYYNTTLLEYKKQIEGLRKNYGELQNAYWKLLGSQEMEEMMKPTEIQINLNGSNLKEFKENSTIASSSIRKSIMLDHPLELSRQKLANLGNSLCLARSPLKNSFTLESMSPERVKTIEAENPQDESKFMLQEMMEIKKELQETKMKLNQEGDDMRQFYEKNMKKLQEILERERKHTRLLNGVISRMRNEMESKDKILRYIVDTKNTDSNTIQRMVKSMKVKI